MLVHPQFDPIAFKLGPLAIRWYGLMYLAAFVAFMLLGKLRARQNLLTGWHPRDVDDMLFYGVFGVILGGRLGYVVFYKPMYYLQHPLEILSVWEGGMSSVSYTHLDVYKRQPLHYTQYSLRWL